MEEYNYPRVVVVKPLRSIGLVIILITVFGPIGLFYATIAGGIIMTVIPIAAAIYMLYELAMGNVELFMYYLLGNLFLPIIWWIICLVWGIFAVSSYNQELLMQASNSMQPFYPKENRNDEESAEDTPLKAWLKNNPTKGINDYYQELRGRF